MDGGPHPLRSTSGREVSSHPLLSTSMGGRGICDGPTPPTPAPQEARRSDQADCYTDLHLRISTLIGGAGYWLHAGYTKRSDRTTPESHIPHEKEVPPGACWIIAPSQLLLQDWDAGMEESSHPCYPLSVGALQFSLPAGHVYICALRARSDPSQVGPPTACAARWLAQHPPPAGVYQPKAVVRRDCTTQWPHARTLSRRPAARPGWLRWRAQSRR
jgi:hypothetical protein